MAGFNGTWTSDDRGGKGLEFRKATLISLAFCEVIRYQFTSFSSTIKAVNERTVRAPEEMVHILLACSSRNCRN